MLIAQVTEWAQSCNLVSFCSKISTPFYLDYFKRLRSWIMSHLVGSSILADFGEDGICAGRITKYCNSRGHHVIYDDGDSEWIESIMVCSCLFG